MQEEIRHGENDLRADVGLRRAQYADVTTSLASAGLTAEFVQTGGMCAASKDVLDPVKVVVSALDQTAAVDRTAPWVREACSSHPVGKHRKR